MTQSSPLIAISGRRWPGTRLSSMEPRYQVREFDMFFSDYSRTLAELGALPVYVPYDCDPRALTARVDGLLITGGQDIAPRFWGGSDQDSDAEIDEARDLYELSLVDAAMESGIPILGICRGMQLLNVAFGGSLVPDLPSGDLDHRGSGHGVDWLAHVVRTEPGSLAAEVFGDEVQVNSLHHQAVDRPGDRVSVTGRAIDGVAEVIEIVGSPVLGVQWHPEWMPHSDPSLSWLVRQASEASAISQEREPSGRNAK